MLDTTWSKTLGLTQIGVTMEVVILFGILSFSLVLLRILIALNSN